MDILRMEPNIHFIFVNVSSQYRFCNYPSGDGKCDWRRRKRRWMRRRRRWMRLRVSDARARLEWLARWNMGDQSTLIYSQLDGRAEGEEGGRRRWREERNEMEGVGKLWKLVSLTHLQSLQRWQHNGGENTHPHSSSLHCIKLSSAEVAE